jgi:hypothetical protein
MTSTEGKKWLSINSKCTAFIQTMNPYGDISLHELSDFLPSLIDECDINVELLRFLRDFFLAVCFVELMKEGKNNAGDL